MHVYHRCLFHPRVPIPNVRVPLLLHQFPYPNIRHLVGSINSMVLSLAHMIKSLSQSLAISVLNYRKGWLLQTIFWEPLIFSLWVGHSMCSLGKCNFKVKKNESYLLIAVDVKLHWHYVKLWEYREGKNFCKFPNYHKNIKE